MITEESFHKRNGILVTAIAYYGNNQAIPIIGNIVILTNCIITHHMNTFIHYMNYSMLDMTSHQLQQSK